MCSSDLQVLQALEEIAEGGDAAAAGAGRDICLAELLLVRQAHGHRHANGNEDLTKTK